ncbi:hypothetical protein GCM10028801_31210 [Nocardioides maradonensis]
MKKITLKSPADVATIVPVMLGFAPEHSMVLLTFGPRAFHARIDLPGRDTGTFEDMVERLVSPCIRHQVEKVVLASYGGALEQVQRLGHEFDKVGIEVLIACTVDVLHDHATVTTVHGTWETVTNPEYKSRAQVADEIEPRGTEHSAWAGDKEQRDNIYRTLGRDTAEDLVARLCVELANLDPGHKDTGQVAKVLALAAWLMGDGALAWIAHDVAARYMKGDPVLTFVQTALDIAIPPSAWDDFRKEIA